MGSISGSGRSPEGGNSNTLVFLPGKSLGQRSLVGYSWWGGKESDTTERLNNRKLSLSCPPFLSEAVSEVKWNEMKWKSLSHVWLFVTPWLHAILQARILEWVAFPFSKGSSQPRDWTQVSCITGRFVTVLAIGWRRKWQPTPVFLPGKFHEQRSLAGYSPCVAKSWTRLSTHM